MLSLHSLALVLLKGFLASYFIAHGLDLSRNIDTVLPQLQANLLVFLGPKLTPTAHLLTIYSHLEVVIGVVALLGWRSARFIGLAAYLFNGFLIGEARDGMTLGKFVLMQA